MLGLIIILAFIAGLSNAIQDTIRHHWDTSIFARIRSECWRKWFQSDWRNKPHHPFWFLWDGWHCFKTVEQIGWLMAIALASSWRNAIAFGMIWAMTFNIFYHKILLLKK